MPSRSFSFIHFFCIFSLLWIIHILNKIIRLTHINILTLEKYARSYQVIKLRGIWEKSWNQYVIVLSQDINTDFKCHFEIQNCRARGNGYLLFICGGQTGKVLVPHRSIQCCWNWIKCTTAQCIINFVISTECYMSKPNGNTRTSKAINNEHAMYFLNRFLVRQIREYKHTSVSRIQVGLVFWISQITQANTCIHVPIGQSKNTCINYEKAEKVLEIFTLEQLHTNKEKRKYLTIFICLTHLLEIILAYLESLLFIYLFFFLMRSIATGHYCSNWKLYSLFMRK